MSELHHRLQGKTAIVTGGSSGIGRAIALAFGREGARVVVGHYDGEAEAAAAVVAEVKRAGSLAISQYVDVSQAERVERMLAATIEAFGRVDVLVSNAGVCPWYPFLEIPMDVWERTQAVNHRGTFLCCQLIARQMVSQGIGGSIIAIGSVGAYTGGPLQAHYNASKAAVGALMRSMAVALGPHRIRCNSILPGCIATRMNEQQREDPDELGRLVSATPLRRIGNPEDLAGAALFLASEESAFCTGAEIRVDGGIAISS
jgi:L-rhamnose 1-dehydrogenase